MACRPRGCVLVRCADDPVLHRWRQIITPVCTARNPGAHRLKCVVTTPHHGQYILCLGEAGRFTAVIRLARA